jgi:PilZ domain
MDARNKERRRSERVVLRIPVVVSAKMADGNVVHYEPNTLVVNAHGGLLDVGIEIPSGQTFVLSHPKTKMAEPCKVVRVDKLEDGRFAVAFEFDVPAPHFWPVVFPPRDWCNDRLGIATRYRRAPLEVR